MNFIVQSVARICPVTAVKRWLQRLGVSGAQVSIGLNAQLDWRFPGSSAQAIT